MSDAVVIALIVGIPAIIGSLGTVGTLWMQYQLKKLGLETHDLVNGQSELLIATTKAASALQGQQEGRIEERQRAERIEDKVERAEVRQEARDERADRGQYPGRDLSN